MIVVQQEILQYESINIVTTHPSYNGATSYNFGDIIFYQHYYYRSVTDNNTGNIPSEKSNSWLRWAISNRYAQIDLRATTETRWDSTTATNPADNALITEFKNDGYNVLSFGKVQGDTVTIEILDTFGAVRYTSTNIVYDRPNSNNWYGYYFDPFHGGVKQDFHNSIPIYQDGTIRVTVTLTDTGFASVGYMVGGQSIYVGDSLYGLSVGFDDNSIIDVDDWGITTLIKRIASESMDIDVTFPAMQIQQMKRNTRDIFGTIVLFVGDENPTSEYEHLMILGYVESYTTVLANSVQIQGSYSIKEII